MENENPKMEQADAKSYAPKAPRGDLTAASESPEKSNKRQNKNFNQSQAKSEIKDNDNQFILHKSSRIDPQKHINLVQSVQQ